MAWKTEVLGGVNYLTSPRYVSNIIIVIQILWNLSQLCSKKILHTQNQHTKAGTNLQMYLIINNSYRILFRLYCNRSRDLAL